MDRPPVRGALRRGNGVRGRARGRRPPRHNSDLHSQSVLVDSLQSLFDTVEMQFDAMTYKTQRCTVRACSQDLCPFYHSDADRRRNVNEHHYDAKPCKWIFSGEKWKSVSECKFRDECRFAHSVYEIRYHPKQYKTQNCEDSACNLGLMCWNKHESGLRDVSENRQTKEETNAHKPIEQLLEEKESKAQRLTDELADLNSRLSALETSLEDANRRATCFRCGVYPITKALIPCGHVLCTNCVDNGNDKCPACSSIAMLVLELKLGL